MNKAIRVLCLITVLCLSGHAASATDTDLPLSPGAQLFPSALLPSDFVVYVRGNTVTIHDSEGFEKRILPSVAHYSGNDGGYVAIYTRQAEDAVYPVGGGIYVAGQIRVKGRYVGRIFYPEGYNEGDDITHDPGILDLCHTYFPDLGNDIWLGGDTGGWFGIQ